GSPSIGIRCLRWPSPSWAEPERGRPPSNNSSARKGQGREPSERSPPGEEVPSRSMPSKRPTTVPTHSLAMVGPRCPNSAQKSSRESSNRDARKFKRTGLRCQTRPGHTGTTWPNSAEDPWPPTEASRTKSDTFTGNLSMRPADKIPSPKPSSRIWEASPAMPWSKSKPRMAPRTCPWRMPSRTSATRSPRERCGSSTRNLREGPWKMLPESRGQEATVPSAGPARNLPKRGSACRERNGVRRILSPPRWHRGLGTSSNSPPMPSGSSRFWRSTPTPRREWECHPTREAPTSTGTRQDTRGTDGYGVVGVRERPLCGLSYRPRRHQVGVQGQHQSLRHHRRKGRASARRQPQRHQDHGEVR